MQSTIIHSREYTGPTTSTGTQNTLIHTQNIHSTIIYIRVTPQDCNTIKKCAFINAKHHNSYPSHYPQECEAQIINLNNAKHHYSYTIHINRNAKHNHSSLEIHSTTIHIQATPSGLQLGVTVKERKRVATSWRYVHSDCYKRVQNGQAVIM